MIPRIKTLAVLDDFRLAVEFDDGYKVIYDVKEDIETLPSFSSRNHKRCMFNRCKYTHYSRNGKDFYRKLSFKRTTVVTIKGKLP